MTYHVATDGSGDYTTIAQVNAATFLAGDSVLFKREDSWTDNLEITWSGTTGNPITFSNYGTGNLPRLNSPGGFSIIKIQNVHDIVIDGLSTYSNGADDPYSRSIQVNEGTTTAPVYNLTIKNCKIYANDDGGKIGGINIGSSTGVDGCHDISVLNNTIIGSNEIGIQCYSGVSSGILYNVTIQGNTVQDITAETGQPGHGINVGWYAGNVTVDGNFVSGCLRYGIVIDSGVSDVTVKNNVCYNNLYNMGNENDALHGLSDDIFFYNNTLIYGASTTNAGFRFAEGLGGTDYEIKNNIVYANTDSDYLINDSVGKLTDVVSDYNCFYVTTGNPPTFKVAGSTYNSLTLWQATSQDSNSIAADPLLNSHYKLKENSPCRGAGENGEDIGAYQYVDTTILGVLV